MSSSDESEGESGAVVDQRLVRPHMYEPVARARPPARVPEERRVRVGNTDW